jgi:hypothetical protein
MKKLLMALLLTCSMPVFGAISYWGNFNGPLTGNADTAKVANSLVSTITPEQFGAKADMVTLYDISCTNGQAQIYSPSGPFVASDVGKWMLIYTSTANTNYVLSMITDYISSQYVGISNSATFDATQSAMANFGTSSLTNFQSISNYCSTNFNTIVVLSNSSRPYMLVGPLIHTGTNQWSMISMPNANQASTNAISSITFYGAGPMRQSYSTFFNNMSPVRSGSVIFCVPTTPLNTTNNSIFGQSGPVSQFSSVNLYIINIALLQPCWPRLNAIWSEYGGQTFIDHCELGVDFRPGFFNTITPSPYNAVGVMFPVRQNNGGNVMQNSEIYGYNKGVVMNEHLKIEDVTCGFNSIGIYVGYGGGDDKVFGHMFRNSTNIGITPGIANASVDLNVCCEGHANGATIIDFDDQSRVYNGSFSCNGGEVPVFSGGYVPPFCIPPNASFSFHDFAAAGNGTDPLFGDFFNKLTVLGTANFPSHVSGFTNSFTIGGGSGTLEPSYGSYGLRQDPHYKIWRWYGSSTVTAPSFEFVGLENHEIQMSIVPAGQTYFDAAPTTGTVVASNFVANGSLAIATNTLAAPTFVGYGVLSVGGPGCTNLYITLSVGGVLITNKIQYSGVFP